eukprot:2941560-Pleurochrysis_carterae.AAC.1
MFSSISGLKQWRTINNTTKAFNTHVNLAACSAIVCAGHAWPNICPTRHEKILRDALADPIAAAALAAFAGSSDDQRSRVPCAVCAATLGSAQQKRTLNSTDTGARCTFIPRASTPHSAAAAVAHARTPAWTRAKSTSLVRASASIARAACSIAEATAEAGDCFNWCVGTPAAELLGCVVVGVVAIVCATALRIAARNGAMKIGRSMGNDGEVAARRDVKHAPDDARALLPFSCTETLL